LKYEVATSGLLHTVAKFYMNIMPSEIHIL